MGILAYPVGGFIVIFLASLLLFGELLVNTKGFLAFIGIVLYGLYFIFNVSPHSLIWIIGLMVFGILFIIIDGKLINHGFVAMLGLIMVMVAIALPSPSIFYAVMVSFAFLIGVGVSFAFLKIFEPRKFWGKVMLLDQQTSEMGYNSMNNNYSRLVGKEGLSVTPFRPTGTIEVEGNRYSATTNDVWLEAGVPIVVVSIDGTRIVVKQAPDNE